jgi:hypothetical protein
MDTDQQQDDEDERLAGEFLLGAEAILKYLISLGVLPADATVEDVYYLRRSKRWPIGSTAGDDGGKLIAIKRRLGRHAQKIASG